MQRGRFAVAAVRAARPLVLTLLAALAATQTSVAQEFTVVFDDGFGEAGPAPRQDLPGGGFEYLIDYCPTCVEMDSEGVSHGEIFGTGLFQSLLRLDVNAGDEATFLASEQGFMPDLQIDNVFARITGDASEIFGVLGSDIEGASLWLLNPRGVLFGPESQIDVDGSFHVTTADALRFTAGPDLS